jgi:hypothetical protein
MAGEVGRLWQLLPMFTTQSGELTNYEGHGSSSCHACSLKYGRPWDQFMLCLQPAAGMPC